MTRFLGVLAIFAALSGVPLAAGPTFNLVNDFSATTNPTGVWSYGEASSPNGAFSNFAFRETDASPAVDYWVNQPFASGFPNYYPLLRHNNTGAPIDGGGGFILPADMISFDPGDSLESGARFTAPTTDFYTFTGSFQGLQNNTSTNVSIYLNLGAIALFAATIDDNSVTRQSQPFSFGISLAAGDVLDFRVDARGNNNSDSTGLAINVAEGSVSGVPEPSSMILLAGGLAACWLVNRRRQESR